MLSRHCVVRFDSEAGRALGYVSIPVPRDGHHRTSSVDLTLGGVRVGSLVMTIAADVKSTVLQSISDLQQ